MATTMENGKAVDCSMAGAMDDGKAMVQQDSEAATEQEQEADAMLEEKSFKDQLAEVQEDGSRRPTSQTEEGGPPTPIFLRFRLLFSGEGYNNQPEIKRSMARGGGGV
jgi:hypothetical protein